MAKILDVAQQRILKVNDDKRSNISKKYELSQYKLYADEYKETLNSLKKWRAQQKKLQDQQKSIKANKLLKGE